MVHSIENASVRDTPRASAGCLTCESRFLRTVLVLTASFAGRSFQLLVRKKHHCINALGPQGVCVQPLRAPSGLEHRHGGRGACLGMAAVDPPRWLGPHDETPRARDCASGRHCGKAKHLKAWGSLAPRITAAPVGNESILRGRGHGNLLLDPRRLLSCLFEERQHLNTQQFADLETLCV